MKHNTCRDNLSAYLDCEMREDERDALEIHLAACAECRAELEQLKTVSGMLKKHAMEPVPPALREAVLGRRGPSISWLKPSLFFGAAAALLLIYSLTRPGREAGSAPGTGAPSEAAAPGPAAKAPPEAKPPAAAKSTTAPERQAAPAPTEKPSPPPPGAAGAQEFSGPVCVLAGDPALLNESDDRVHEALVFLEKSGARLERAEPGLLVFVRKNGSRKLVREKDCSSCFILFDGSGNPLVVSDPSAVPDAYRRYFGTDKSGRPPDGGLHDGLGSGPKPVQQQNRFTSAPISSTREGL